MESDVEPSSGEPVHRPGTETWAEQHDRERRAAAAAQRDALTAVYAAQLEERDRLQAEREDLRNRHHDKRDRAADERDRTADKRDRTADAREQQANLREARADERELTDLERHLQADQGEL